MPGRSCCIPGCRSNYDRYAEYVSVFYFPKDIELRNKWLKLINRVNFKPSRTTVVCGKHFEPQCIIKEDKFEVFDGPSLIVPRARPKLTEDACPTIFPDYQDSQKSKKRTAPQNLDDLLEIDDWCFNENSGVEIAVCKTDVLICGYCHSALYDIADFQKHRSDSKCTQESLLTAKERIEPKEQIWAFALWKNGLLRSLEKGEPTASWTLFRWWCALNENDKKAWIIAGQQLQNTNNMKKKIQNMSEFVVKKSKTEETPEQLNATVISQNKNLEEGEICVSELSDAQRMAIRAEIAAVHINTENTTADQPRNKLTRLYSDLLKKPTGVQKALRTINKNSVEETGFTKILSRRYNGRKQRLEYLTKWDNSEEFGNTWEPRMHFKKCRQAIDDFDRTFNMKIVPKTLTTPSINVDNFVESKQASLRSEQSNKRIQAQIQRWCDIILKNDKESVETQLAHISNNLNDDFENRIEIEMAGECSSEIRSDQTTSEAAEQSTGPVLSSERIVQIGQNVPSAQQDFYIKSKSKGIIKLNSNTSIPDSNLLLKIGNKKQQASTKEENIRQSKAAPILVKESDIILIDSPSDNLPELECPTNLIPDSPISDFILDPVTGKISGVDYDKIEVEHDQVSERGTKSLESLVKSTVSIVNNYNEIQCITDFHTKSKSDVCNTLKVKLPASGGLDFDIMSISDEEVPAFKSNTKMVTDEKCSNHHVNNTPHTPVQQIGNTTIYKTTLKCTPEMEQSQTNSNLPDTDDPIFITDDDGTVYQIAGENEDGQTILLREGSNGQEQCILMTSETTENTKMPFSVTENHSDQQQAELIEVIDVEDSDEESNVIPNVGDSDAESDTSEGTQIVAQIVKANPPSPGGTRKVVLMLPNQKVMMTTVTAQQYAELELAM